MYYNDVVHPKGLYNITSMYNSMLLKKQRRYSFITSEEFFMTIELFDSLVPLDEGIQELLKIPNAIKNPKYLRSIMIRSLIEGYVEANKYKLKDKYEAIKISN